MVQTHCVVLMKEEAGRHTSVACQKTCHWGVPHPLLLHKIVNVFPFLFAGARLLIRFLGLHGGG